MFRHRPVPDMIRDERRFIGHNMRQRMEVVSGVR
jgi:hypothetical protein